MILHVLHASHFKKLENSKRKSGIRSLRMNFFQSLISAGGGVFSGLEIKSLLLLSFYLRLATYIAKYENASSSQETNLQYNSKLSKTSSR